MKKYIVAIVFAFSLLTVPTLSFAADSTTSCENDGGISPEVAGLFPTKFCSASELIVGIVKIILSLSGIVAVLFIAIGGMRYIVAAQQGSGDKAVAVAKNMITNAVIGLVIVIMAYTLVTITLNLIAPQGSNSGTPPNTESTGTGSDSGSDPFGDVIVPCDDDDATLPPPCS